LSFPQGGKTLFFWSPPIEISFCPLISIEEVSFLSIIRGTGGPFSFFERDSVSLLEEGVSTYVLWFLLRYEIVEVVRGCPFSMLSEEKTSSDCSKRFFHYGRGGLLVGLGSGSRGEVARASGHRGIRRPQDR